MTTPELPPPAAEPPVRVRPRRHGGSPLDMVRSLGLVGIVVVGLVAFTFFGQPKHPPVTVDVAATVQAARTEAGFPVLAASSLPTGWYANYADFVLGSGGDSFSKFHVGYVTSDQHFFAVDTVDTGTPQAPKPEDALPVRVETFAGLKFSVYDGNGTETWIHDASATSGYVITLTGSGTQAEWSTFVAALSADGAIAS